MDKAFFGVLVFVGIIVMIVLFVLFRFLYRIYRQIRDAKRAVEDALGGGRSDRTGRRAQQYHYGDNGRQQRSSGPINDAAQNEPRRTQTQSGEVIIDHRDQSRENKKIFSDDDGEYVDFSES
jgi:hypothetical protein